MKQPDWATNTDKFTRALAWVTEQHKLGIMDITEDTVKERYVALGGLVSAEKLREAPDATTVALEDMTVPALKKRAADQNIDVSAATSKAEIIATIREVEDAD